MKSILTMMVLVLSTANLAQASSTFPEGRLAQGLSVAREVNPSTAGLLRKDADQGLTGYRLAQADVDDAYDPFSDYSEFDEASDEEADINFFRNGRFFVLGFEGGLRNFTQNLGKLYSSAPTYGLFLTFFFDLRFALQGGFLTGDHSFSLTTANGTSTGNVSMTFLDLSLKYYLNTQNVTRGLADLNPYLIGGVGQVYRTLTLTGTSDSARDATMGLHAGLGLEIPLMRKKAFFGAQAMYRFFTFSDENEYMVDPAAPVPGTKTTVKPNGDSYDLLAILGLNF